MWTRLDSFEAPLCATERCNCMGVAADWHFERGEIGSYYCNICKTSIERQAFDRAANRALRRSVKIVHKAKSAETPTE